MVSVQNWLEEKRQDENDPKHIRAVEALALLLKGEASPLETAKSIATTYEPTGRDMCDNNQMGLYYSKIYAFWALFFCDAIHTFGSVDTHERLIDFLVAIFEQPDLLDEDGERVTGYRNSVYWFDVPRWVLAFVQDGLCNVSRKIP